MIRPRPLPGGLTTSDFENRNLFVVTEGQLNLTLASTHWMPTAVTTKNVSQHSQSFLGAALPGSGISVLVCNMKASFPLHGDSGQCKQDGIRHVTRGVDRCRQTLLWLSDPSPLTRFMEVRAVPHDAEGASNPGAANKARGTRVRSVLCLPQTLCHWQHEPSFSTYREATAGLSRSPAKSRAHA